MSEQLIIRHPELAALAAQQDIFAFVRRLEGPVARVAPGRETRRFEFSGRAYYRKLHTGVGWGEIFKNLLRLRLPIIGARNEWDALNHLTRQGIHTLTPVAFGVRGFNPATQLSFLITEELGNTVKLHDLLADQARWRALGFAKHQQILNEVARIARLMHAAGINHRDFYLCHFLLDIDSLAATRPITIFLVDLHRAQQRKQVPLRWQIKDLASLEFSSRDYGLSARTQYRFLRAYFTQPLRQILQHQTPLLTKLRVRADQLYAREQRLRAKGLRP